MRRTKLTQTFIEGLKAGKAAYTIHDTKLHGFGITVYPGGGKSWFIRTQSGGHRKWHRPGDAVRMDEATARHHAKNIAMEADRADACPVPALRAAPFEDVAAEFLTRYRRNWKDTTCRGSCQAMTAYILPWFTGKRIAAITHRDVEAWFASLADRPGSANRALPLLPVMMQQAELYGYRPEGSNPCKGITRYKRSKMERFLRAEEMTRPGASLDAFGSRYPLTCALIRLLILTGARKGEMLALRWHDYRDGHIHLPDSKTGERHIFLSAPARRLLDGLPRLSPWVGLAGPDSDLPMQATTLFYHWKHIRHAAGLDDVRLHDLHHSYASIALAHGEHLLVIGRLLGHVDADTTLKYAHLIDEQVARTARAVSCALSGMAGR